MAKTRSAFPVTIDSTLQGDRATGELITSSSYDVIEDALYQLETKVGVDSSAVTGSLDYKVGKSALIDGTRSFTGEITGTNAKMTTVKATTLTGTTFSGDSVKATTITATTVSATSFSGTTYGGTTLTATDVSGTTIKSTTVTATTISSTDVKATTITATTLSGTTFSGSDVKTTTITATNISAASFSATTITATTFSGSNVYATTVTASTISANTYSGMAGQTVQIVNVQSAAYAAGTILIPLDDTIPQSNEGDQYLTLAITPTSNSNILYIDVDLFYSYTAVSCIVAALFRDSGADAIASAWQDIPTINGKGHVFFRHKVTSPGTSSTTFKVRMGGTSSGTLYLNGSQASGLLGGTLASSITITEVAG